MFTVAQMNLRVHEDYIREYVQPDFISVNYYETISAEELSPYQRLSPTVSGTMCPEGSWFDYTATKYSGAGLRAYADAGILAGSSGINISW